MSEDIADRLPVRVGRMGGSIAMVLSWDQHLAVLSRGQMFEIADIVGRFPELNTEFAVDLLADLAGHYKQGMGTWFDELIGEYGIEGIYLAVSCLEEFGIRSRSDERDASHEDAEIGSMVEMLELLDRLKRLDFEAATLEAVQHRLNILGGWSVASTLSDEEIFDILSGNPTVLPQAMERIRKERNRTAKANQKEPDDEDDDNDEDDDE